MKRLVTVLGAVLALNFLAVAGVGGYAWTQGWLTPDRVRGAVAILQDGVAEDEGEAGIDISAPRPAITVANRGRGGAQGSLMRQAEMDRRVSEIEHAWQQLEVQQLAFLQEREALAEKQRRYEAEADARARAAGASGWKREIELFGGIKPALAKQLLRERADVEVVKILEDLDVRTAKKIVDKCRTEEERLWIGRILGQLQNQNATQAEALAAGATGNPGA